MHGSAGLIQDLAVLLVMAAGAAFVFDRLKLPVVMGYVLAGALLGPSFFHSSPLVDAENIHTWAQLGVIFLMFHLGLEFSFRRLLRLGPSILFVGLFEVAMMAAVGWLVALGLGYHPPSTSFVAVAVAISSTTIIVKTFNDLGLTKRRFAELVTGILVVEDLLAVLLIVALGSKAQAAFDGARLFGLAAEMIVVMGGWVVIGTLLVPRFLNQFGRADARDELTILLTVGLCLLLATTAVNFGYSAALGAFIMGSILNESPEAERVRTLVLPLRDLFAAIFFLSVGLLADFNQIAASLPEVLALVAIVIVGKMIFVCTALLLAGADLRSSVRAALAMSQVGEFSFILVATGVASGQLPAAFQPVIVAVAIITSFATPTFLRLSPRVADALERSLPPRFARVLELYRARLQTMRDGRLFPHWLRPGLGKLCLNALLVALIFGASARYLRPRALEWLAPNLLLGSSVSYLVTIFVAAPFLFGMLTAGRVASGDLSHLRAMRAFVFVFVTIVWVGALSAQHVSAFASVLLVVIFSAVLLAAFYGRLRDSYEWLEGRFLSGLKTPAEPDALSRLAPWDAHLVRLHVHANASVAGHALEVTGLKRDFDLVVIAIRRGDRIIALPKGDEPLFPHDELLVLGTDEQIDRARPRVEDGMFASSTSSLLDYQLRAYRVTEATGLGGRAIKDSRLRETRGSLIVGVERAGARFLTPPPLFRLEVGDTLWLAGPRLEVT